MTDKNKACGNACVNYLSFERSIGGYENILVITDHLSRYAQAIPRGKQTIARVLHENFFINYGFTSTLLIDKDLILENKIIKQLSKIANIKKTRTTPYHPMGNGMMEIFYKT